MGDFVWSYDSSMYGIRESASSLKVYKNFKEDKTIRLDYHAEGIYGGALFGVRTKDFICFYDWIDGTVVRRIDVGGQGLFRHLLQISLVHHRVQDPGHQGQHG